MLVNYWMNKNPITVDADDSMKKAMDLIEKNKIHILPVLNDNKLIGVVTDHDLKQAQTAIASTINSYDFNDIYLEIKVKSFMPMELISIPWNFSIEETAETLMEKKIDGAPVIDNDGQLIGVITKTDLFKALISLTGLKKRGIKFGMIVSDRPGAIQNITKIIGKYGGKTASILTSYERVPAGYRRVYLRTYNINRQTLPELEEILKEKTRLLYVLDHREGKREIFIDDYDLKADITPNIKDKNDQLNI